MGEIIGVIHWAVIVEHERIGRVAHGLCGKNLVERLTFGTRSTKERARVTCEECQQILKQRDEDASDD